MDRAAGRHGPFGRRTREVRLVPQLESGQNCSDCLFRPAQPASEGLSGSYATAIVEMFASLNTAILFDLIGCGLVACVISALMYDAGRLL
jgi:hypothetical protein